MTGTHMRKVGDDYCEMMDQTQWKSLSIKNGGVLAREIDHLARLHGLDMAELESCPLRDYGTLDCLNDMKAGQ